MKVWFILGGVFFVFLVLFTIVRLSPKQTDLPTRAVNVAKPTSIPKQQYRIAYDDNNGSVENIFVEIKPSDDTENTVKAISLTIEKNVCKQQCNINIFDDASALQLQYDYLQKSVDFTPQQDTTWAKSNYIFVADHYVGNHEFETPGDFTYYPFRNDSTYKQYATQ